MTLRTNPPTASTVKVNASSPALPSAALSVVAAIDSVGGGGASSFRIVAVAAAVPSVDPVGADSVTVNVSSGSTTVSPATFTVIVAVAWPATNDTVPDGSTPPAKSAAVAVPPVTAYDADDAPDKSPTASP